MSRYFMMAVLLEIPGYAYMTAYIRKYRSTRRECSVVCIRSSDFVEIRFVVSNLIFRPSGLEMNIPALHTFYGINPLSGALSTRLPKGTILRTEMVQDTTRGKVQQKINKSRYMSYQMAPFPRTFDDLD